MKIAIYGDIGGSGGYLRYCQGLIESGGIPEDIDIWFVSPKKLWKKIKRPDAKVKYLTHPWMNSKSRIKRYAWYLWVFPRMIKKIGPDVEFYPSGHSRAYFRKSKIITTCHNLLLFEANEIQSVPNKKTLRYYHTYRRQQARSFQKSDGVIFLSEYSRSLVHQRVRGIRDSTVIPHGLDPVFRNMETRSYEIWNEAHLLYVSPFYDYKHQIEVIKALRMIRKSANMDIRLKLIGGGEKSKKAKLRACANEEHVQDHVVLVDEMNYEDIMNEYKNSDIFVFASSCETFGITLLEAMGAGLPIACSNRSGLPQILKDAGVYFNPLKPASIAQAVLSLVADRQTRRALGERAHQYALEYTWERCAEKTYAYIRSVFQTGPR